MDLGNERLDIFGAHLGGPLRRRQVGHCRGSCGLGFADPLSDEVGIGASFEGGLVASDLGVGVVDPPLSQLRREVLRAKADGCSREVGHRLVDVVGVEESGEPVVDMVGDAVFADIGVAGMFDVEFAAAGILGGVSEPASVEGAVVPPVPFEPLAAAAAGDETSQDIRSAAPSLAPNPRVSPTDELVLNGSEGVSVDERFLGLFGRPDPVVSLVGSEPLDRPEGDVLDVEQHIGAECFVPDLVPEVARIAQDRTNR